MLILALVLIAAPAPYSGLGPKSVSPEVLEKFRAPPLPSDAHAAHILAEAQRIFAEDLAEIPEVT